MSTWPTAPIGELCNLVNGRAFNPSDWSDEGAPIVRIQNLNDEEKPFNHYQGEVKEKFLVRSGDILLSWSGTPGTSFGCFVWGRGRAILNQHIFRVEVDEARIDRDYFVHAVNSRLEEMIALAHGGVGLRHITKGKLEGIRLPVPPKDEQRRIVTRIQECLERVEEIQALRVEAQAMANSLFAAHLSEVARRGAWAPVPLTELLADTQNGRSIRSEGGGNGAVLTLSAVRAVRADLSATKRIVLDDAVAERYAVRKGDVFISRSNTRDLVGLSSIVVDDPEEALIFPDLLIRLTPRPERLHARFLAYGLRFPDVRRQIKDRATGSSQSMVKISSERLGEVQLPVPPRADQGRLADELEAAHEACAAVQASLLQPEVDHMRSAILRKAFSLGT
jgi:type I restriction enzyme, S subunit